MKGVKTMIERFCEVTGKDFEKVESVIITIKATAFVLGCVALIRPACWLFIKLCEVL